jgi:curli biogenesis system outer membrane secretion channel CsgG
MELSRKKSFGLFLALATLVSGCATETYQKVAVTKVEANRTAYTGLKSTLVLGEFNNRSNYMQGLFSSNIDKLGHQGKTIL